MISRMSMFGMCRCLAISTSLFFVLFTSAIAGTIVEGNVTIDIEGRNTETGATMTDQVLVQIQEDGSFNLLGAVSSTPMWEANVNANGHVDPVVFLGFGTTNLLAVPVEFTFTISTPIAPIIGGTVHGGSTGGSVTDDGDGVGGISPITSVPGTPFYAGQIDAATVLAIYPDPFAFPALNTFAFGGQTVNIPALNPGLPGPTLPSGPALATIGIVHKFTLAPLDSMGASSFFQVEVPEPSSIVLAVIGGLGLLLLARRRK